MRWIDIIRISVRMVFSNRLRTSLTVLGIGTAIGLVIVLTGLGYGIQEITIGSIVKSQSLLSLDVAPGPDNTIPLTDETVATIRHLPKIADVSPVLTTEGQVKFNGKRMSNTVNGVEDNFFTTEGIILSGGKRFSGADNEIILSPQSLGLLETDVGSILGQDILFSFVNPLSENELITIPTPLKVVGITSGADSTDMFVPYSLFTQIKPLKMTGIKVLAKDRDGVITAQAALKTQGYTVDTLLETLDSARRVFRWVTISLVVIAFIALIVASIGMFNTLTIALLERTREIGIMKAIGVTNRSIKRLFLAEAVIFGFLGGVMGLVLGLGIARILNSIVNRLALHYGGATIQLFQYPTAFLVGMLIFPMVLGIVTGLYPAIRASHFNPLRALKYE